MNSMKVKYKDIHFNNLHDLLFYMQVTKEMANRSYTGPDGLNPRMLQLEWSGGGEPQRWNEKIFLTGSEDSKFLLLSQPTIGASSGTVLSLTHFAGSIFASFLILHATCVSPLYACNKSKHLET